MVMPNDCLNHSAKIFNRRFLWQINESKILQRWQRLRTMT